MKSTPLNSLYPSPGSSMFEQQIERLYRRGSRVCKPTGFAPKFLGHTCRVDVAMVGGLMSAFSSNPVVWHGNK